MTCSRICVFKRRHIPIILFSYPFAKSSALADVKIKFAGEIRVRGLAHEYKEIDMLWTILVILLIL